MLGKTDPPQLFDIALVSARFASGSKKARSVVHGDNKIARDRDTSN
jgi:hypothetical protein